MFEASKYLKVSAPVIEKSSDSTKEKAIKNIISQMLQLEPADRITTAQAVDRLSELKVDKTKMEEAMAAKEPKDNTTEGQKPKSRKPKWWPS